VVCQGGFTHRVTELTEKASNSFDQERLERPVSATDPAIAPPPSPGYSGSSTVIDRQFEGSLIEKQAHHETTEEGRSTYIFYTIACIDR
jgi:hypothetical protein